MAMCASFGSNTLSESMTFVLTVEVGVLLGIRSLQLSRENSFALVGQLSDLTRSHSSIRTTVSCIIVALWVILFEYRFTCLIHLVSVLRGTK